MDHDKRHQNIATNVVMPWVYKEKLKYLARRTRINQSEFLREAVADLLKKYQHIFQDSEFAELEDLPPFEMEAETEKFI